MGKPKYPPHELLARIKAWCDRQERAHQETRDKLYSWGLHQQEVENVISRLISDNYLNEERFAIAYTSGKFRIKGWGWRKIELNLKQKRISKYCLAAAFADIDQEEYAQSLHRQIEKKNNTLKECDIYTRKAKLAAYMIRRGFEPQLVWEAINEIIGE